MRIFGGADYPFIARRRVAYSVSAALILVSLAATAFHGLSGRGWLEYGIDFEGGVLVHVRTEPALPLDAVRGALVGVGAVEVTRLGNPYELVVRASRADGGTGTVTTTITSTLKRSFPEARIDVLRSELVGPRVGHELRERAAAAIGISFLATLIYLAFRFEPRFGLAAVLATLHDIAITLGLLSALRIEVGVATVASLLTVIGYSLNATIVVFDRIREKLRRAGRTDDEAGLINRAINETLPRTVLTSGTTVAVLLPLLLLGGPVLYDFAVVLLAGIVVGTYSSIFIASPALLAIRRRRATGAAVVRRHEADARRRPHEARTVRPSWGRPHV